MRNWSRYTANIGKKVAVKDPTGTKITGTIYGKIVDYNLFGKYAIEYIDYDNGGNSVTVLDSVPVEWCEIIENEDSSDQDVPGILKENDNVNHPSHYTDGNIETIDFIERFCPNNFHTANAIKYISRAGKKAQSPEQEDIKKAIWYLKRKIKTDKHRLSCVASSYDDDDYIDAYIHDKHLENTLKALAIKMICKYDALEEAVLFLEMYLDIDKGEYPDLKRRFRNENH